MLPRGFALLRWLAAFALTEAVEIPVYARAQAGRSWPRRIAVAAGASALTHPVVWFVAPRVVPGGFVGITVAAEAFAIAIEGAWLRAFGVRRAWAWAVLANALSVGVGLLVRAAVGWP